MLCNGASFDKTQLSDLYTALGTASVPDTRGLFLRGLDTSGKIDNASGGRTLLSDEEGSYLMQDSGGSPASFGAQGDQTGASLTSKNWDYTPTAMSASTSYYSWAQAVGTSVVSSQSSVTPYMLGIARPKNIAVNYIIKAYKISTYVGTPVGNANGLINRQVFSKGGSYTYTPSTGTTKIIVKLCGAGGGGGGVNCWSNYVAMGYGGNGGTYAESPLLPVPTSGTSIVVGAGGTGGASGFNNGSNGGLSSVGTLITAPGGPGGGGCNGCVAGTVAHTSWQQTATATGNVEMCIHGLAGETTFSALAIAVVYPSRGGSSFFGMGSSGGASGGGWNGNDSSPAVINSSTVSGNPATSPGSGGSGATSNGGGAAAGGNGADGIVIIEEYN